MRAWEHPYSDPKDEITPFAFAFVVAPLQGRSRVVELCAKTKFRAVSFVNDENQHTDRCTREIVSSRRNIYKC